ncbi:MAG: hypothetical protein QGG40_11545 [Myxococcota bacterium]|nr:hypothetical protein [Myxococcota bacterium]
MRSEPELQRWFDSFLTRPLTSNRKIRRHLAAELPGLQERLSNLHGAHADASRAVIGRVEVLLEGLTVKTSPFHLRLIHGMVHVLLRKEREGPDLGVDTDVRCLNSVLRTLRRSEQCLPRVGEVEP